MRVEELLVKARNTLQDQEKNFWDDSELLDYYNECKRAMTAERLENKTTATMILDPLQEEYDTSGIIRYISAKDDEGTDRPLYPDDGTGDDDNNGIIILDYNRVLVNDPTLGSNIIFKVVAAPADDNLGNTVRAGDEQALRYYILSKAYEKETEMENFQKASYFYSKYALAFKALKDASSSNYRTGKTNKTQSYFF